MAKGKGIACYTTKKFHLVKEIQSHQYQVALLTSESLDVIGIYRSQIASSVVLLEDLKQLINSKRVTLILGDINACYKENINSKLIQGIINLGFRQLVHEPTHIRGRIIDHAYIFDPSKVNNVECERYL